MVFMVTVILFAIENIGKAKPIITTLKKIDLAVADDNDTTDASAMIDISCQEEVASNSSVASVVWCPWFCTRAEPDVRVYYRKRSNFRRLGFQLVGGKLLVLLLVLVSTTTEATTSEDAM
jgi:hypothetical protein